MDKSLLYLLIGILLLFPVIAFPDADRDGVADGQDRCPASISQIVDNFGCDCRQKLCPGKCLGAIQPKCVEDCKDGIKNQNEEKTDCGGVCAPCPEIKCTNCQKCGCPEQFQCQPSGTCTMQVSLQGKKCKTQDVYYSLKSFDCLKLGPTWIKEDHTKFISFEISRFASKIPFLKNYIKKKAKERFEKVTLCINTEDLGCTTSAKCFGENRLTEENKKKAGELLKKELESRTNLPWYADLFVGVKYKVDLSEFRLDLPYSCPSFLLKAKDSCQAWQVNGKSADKIDLLFISDAYLSDKEMEKALWEITDYNGEFSATAKNGLFSEGIFLQNKEKFNLWYLRGKMRYKEDNYLPGQGEQPSYAEIISLANHCPWYDYIIVLSERDFRSNCMLGAPGPCRISLKEEEYPSRLLLHEFGHGFASLADEYYNYIRRRENLQSFEKFFAEFQMGPNCQKNGEEAATAWQGLNTGYFKGCGGDCSEECEQFVRPTFNSVMRHQNLFCGEETCQEGPPFDQFYEVNEREIEKEIEKFS